MTCDICNGSGNIRLPTYRRATAVVTRETIPTMPEISSKTFLCPQCAGHQIAEEKVQRYGVAMVIPEMLDEHAELLMRGEAARVLADNMINNDAIHFTKEKRGDGQLELVGIVACVTQNQIERIEAKERRASVKYAQRLVSLACEKIAIWGRDLGRTAVNKDEAYRFIREAARDLERER